MKKKSWVKPYAIGLRLLEHEQLHFDISNFWLQKLEEAIAKEKFELYNWQYKLANLHTVFFDEMSTMQHDYDRETENGLNELKQSQWLKRIESMKVKSPL